jgi:hypothetical protein
MRERELAACVRGSSSSVAFVAKRKQRQSLRELAAPFCMWEREVAAPGNEETCKTVLPNACSCVNAIKKRGAQRRQGA